MLESIEGFAKRAAAADVRELWASIGADEQSGLVVLHLSPCSADAAGAERAAAAGIATRSFYVDGDLLFPADGQCSFSEAVLRSSMSRDQKIDLLYETCREYEERIQKGELVTAAPRTA